MGSGCQKTSSGFDLQRRGRSCQINGYTVKCCVEIVDCVIFAGEMERKYGFCAKILLGKFKYYSGVPCNLQNLIKVNGSRLSKVVGCK